MWAYFTQCVHFKDENVMDNQLSRLSELVNVLNRTNSSKDKTDALKQFSDCKKLLKYVFDTTYYQYGITSDNIIKLESQLSSKIDQAVTFSKIDDLLDGLSMRAITGHNAIISALKFIYDNEQYRQLILDIIDRNIKIRIGSAIINKVFPGLISEFDVSLGVALTDYDPNRTKLDFSNNQYYASHKLDGVRCVAIIDNDGNVSFKSRSGKDYTTLATLAESIKQLNLRNCVLDGECCLLNSDGTDDFQGIMKEIRRKNHDVVNAQYRCFDILTTQEFYSKTSNRLFTERQECLNSILNQSSISNIKPLEQRLITSWDELDAYMDEATDLDWEGLMLRRNAVYKGGRSNDLIKVKKFQEREFVVEDVIVGPFRIIDYRPDGTAFEVTEDVVTALVVNYEGNIVKIGSGMSIESRRLFKTNPSLIIGATITVKYFEETVNQDGGKSIRFPTLKTIHGSMRSD